MNLLILGSKAKEYERLIRPEAPDLEISISEDYGPEMVMAAPRAEVILGYHFPEELIKAAAVLKWIQLMSAGADQVLFSPYLRAEVMVTTARGVHSPHMAEYALGVMVALARNLPEMVRNQEKRVWKQWPAESLKDKTLAIIGFGTVGEEIARLASAFGMRIIGLRKSGRPHPLADQMFQPQDLGKVLAQSDFVILTVPLTPETRDLIGFKELAKMKRGAFLINISRGGLVNQEALQRALEEHALAGAALDVFEEEPLPKASPLWGLPNLLLTPHISGVGRDYAQRVAEIFLENFRRFKSGQLLLNLVDRTRGY